MINSDLETHINEKISDQIKKIYTQREISGANNLRRKYADLHKALPISRPKIIDVGQKCQLVVHVRPVQYKEANYLIPHI